MRQRFTKRTRLVSALLTLAMVFTFLPFSALAAGGIHAGSIIELSSTNFPDAAFRAYLKKFDTVGNDGKGDNRLTPAERNAVKEIDVDNKGITTLEGISYFPNLFYLNCKKNQLTELDVSKNPALWGLECDENQLSSLDVSQNAKLVYLYCNSNNLTSLDVSQTAVTTLYASNNKIDIDVDKTSRTFDLSILPGFDGTKASGWVGGTVDGSTLKVDEGATQVTYTYDCGNGLSRDFTLNVNVGSIAIDTLNFPDPNFRAYVKAEFAGNNDSLSESEQNAVTEIDVMEGYNGQKITSLKGIEFFPNLERLLCSENNLTSLDVSKNIALKVLWCEKNNLTSLDVSKNTALIALDCHQNSLTSLDVSQTAVTSLDASGNQIDINVETTPRTFDLSTLPGFDGSKASGWVGGTVDGSTLKVDEGATQVTYTYDCGKSRNVDFTLNVNVVPDSTVTPPEPPVTPPSGGDGTGTTTPPSGGDGTGTTTPPSGGDGTGTTTPPSGGGTGTTTPPSGGGTGTTTPPSGGGTGTTTPPSGGGTGTTTPPSGGGTGTTTPPSGGDGTGTTTPPSGGGTGTTTPPSGGGTGTTTPPSGGGTGTTTPPSGGGGGGAAILLVGGAAVAGLVGYGVYSYVSEQQLKALLPEGVAVPENRAQTALLLWNTAGRPEPAAQPAFPDVADPDTAKAAQWCMEQNLLQTRRDGAFAPDSTLPVYKTLKVYRQLTGK